MLVGVDQGIAHLPVEPGAVIDKLAPGDTLVKAELKIHQPHLWDLNDPFLYRVSARVEAGSVASRDERSIRCGFRDFRFENGGFRLNGRRIFLRSSHTCNHFPIGLQFPEDPDLLRRCAAAAPDATPLLLRLGVAAMAVLGPPGVPSASSPAGPAPDTAEPAGSARADAADADDPGSDEPSLPDLLAALLAWAAPYPTLAALATAVAGARDRLAALRAAEPRLTLATAHATKGLEFDHVAVIGMSEGRFPSPRALAEAVDPARALEEERRLAYVAWTRARHSLVLAYEPGSPSRFLVETFGPGVVDPSAAASDVP
jgi:hypothetical protein